MKMILQEGCLFLGPIHTHGVCAACIEKGVNVERKNGNMLLTFPPVCPPIGIHPTPDFPVGLVGFPAVP